VSQNPYSVLGHHTVEVSRSHLETLGRTSELAISPNQILLLDNTPKRQTSMPSSGIEPAIANKQAAAE